MNYSLKNSKSLFLWLLLFLPFIPLSYLSTINLVGQFLYYYKIISILCVTFIFIISNVRHPFHFKSVFIVIPYVLLLICTTYIHHANLYDALTRSISIVALTILVDMALYYNPKAFLQSLYYYLSFLIFLNFIFLLIYPNGMFVFVHSAVSDKGNFLGVDNTMAMILVPAMGLIVLYSYYRYKKLTILATTACAIADLTIFISKSSTSMITCLVATLLLIFIVNKPWSKIFNSIVASIVYIAIFLFLVVFQLQFTFQSSFNQLLHIAFNKDMTFDGRTVIWRIAEVFIGQSFMTGYGVPTNPNYTFILIYNQWMHAHDGILQIMYEGGFVTLIGFLFILGCSFFNLYRQRNNNLSVVLVCFIFSFLIQLLTEPQQEAALFICLLIIAIHIDKLVQSQKSLLESHRVKLSIRSGSLVKNRML